MKQWDVEYWKQQQAMETGQAAEGADGLAALPSDEEEELLKATKKAMSLLQHMDRTEWELRSKLQRSEFSAEAIEAAIAYVQSYHYIDDERYARRFVEIYRSSRSMQRIKQDLVKRGVADQYITLAIEEFDGDDSGALQKALEKCLRGKTSLTYDEQQKVMAKLYRRGFRSQDIRRQIDLWKERQEISAEE